MGEQTCPWGDGSLTFRHHRLAINGLRAAGAQPITSRDKRFVMVFNGEIFNFRILNARYRLIPQGEEYSDTDILLELICKLGIRQALGEVDGMYALAILDQKANELFFSRDLKGEKPLYYCNRGGRFLLSSTVTDALSLGYVDELNDEYIQMIVSSGLMIPGQTVFKSIKSAIPGCLYKLETDGSLVSMGEIKNLFQDPSELIEDRLQTAVTRFLDSDIEVGCFLSSGIDSSLVAAFAARQTESLKTFTVGFESGPSEHLVARDYSKIIDSQHFEHIVTKKEIHDAAPLIIETMGAPCLDISYIPTYFASALASRHVKAVLGGDGADELFYGYRRHALTLDLWRYLHPIFASAFYLNLPIGRMRALCAPSLIEYYITLQGGNLDGSWINDLGGYDRENILSLECKFFLQTVLQKVDSASMANSLEVRAPFLSHTFWNSDRPTRNDSVRRGKGKQTLRELHGLVYRGRHSQASKKGFTPGLELVSHLETGEVLPELKKYNVRNKLQKYRLTILDSWIKAHAY